MTHVEIDQELCIGSGNCVHFMPGTFALDDDGLAYVADPGAEDAEQLQAVARQCPTGAVKLRDGDPPLAG
ncbi:MAG TPA: ferredoxin [Conexibacter sp.]